MCYEKMLEYISLFREKAEQGKLVIFVGSGVSCNVAGMPSWNKLIQNMANTVDYSRCDTCRHKKEGCGLTCLLKEDFSTDELLKIPQYVFNKDSELYNRVLTDSIPCVVADAPLSSAIFDINPIHIITTNYDQLLETSSNIFCEQYQVIVSDKDLLNANKGKYIVKMHGDISRPESIVLKEQDYLNYSQKHMLIELFVKSLLVDHIVLFLGYSLNDYNIKLILSWLNYMRSQNNALDKDRKVGYIILDQEKVDNTELSYFNGNNIGVININSMPLIQEIPEDLSNEIGKRLYSFLRVIAEPALEESLSSIGNIVKFMCQFSFISYEKMLKLLYVKNYEVIDWQLHLFSESDYMRLTEFMESEHEGANHLKQLFLNAGIVSIQCIKVGDTMHFSIGEISKNILLQNKLYNLYIFNQYDEINSLLDKDSENFDPNEKFFYRSIINGYSDIMESIKKIDISQLRNEQKIIYLHNLAAVDALQTFSFDSTKVKQFIENIASAKERDLFSEYLDIYEGNPKKCLAIQIALDKLKKDVCDKNTLYIGRTSCAKIYEIKPLVMTQYFFYYNNHILHQGFNDLNKFVRPYIEAIICANGNVAEEPSRFGNIEFKNEKYQLGFIDLDILTKFISTKELKGFIELYNVEKLNIDEGKVQFLVKCFQNLCNSITSVQTYGFGHSSFSVLSNLILLFNLTRLDDNSKKILAKSITVLLSDKTIVQILFSIHWPDYKLTLRELSKLCDLLPLPTNFEIVHKIIDNGKFFDYAVNIRFNNLRHLVGCFLSKDEDTSIKIQTLIDKTENFYEKIILLRLFYPHITGETNQQKYKDFLSINFAQLPTAAIYDFVFSGWLAPAQNSIQDFLNELLEISRKENAGVRSYPSSVETKLECAYLLYINDIILELNSLKELAVERPHLQFLLNPENFDYTQVDFSNYMWENFARREKYMNYFIAHKGAIIPRIQNRIKMEEASEAEKRILYGFLLSGDEVWKI